MEGIFIKVVGVRLELVEDALCTAVVYGITNLIM